MFHMFKCNIQLLLSLKYCYFKWVGKFGIQTWFFVSKLKPRRCLVNAVVTNSQSVSQNF